MRGRRIPQRLKNLTPVLDPREFDEPKPVDLLLLGRDLWRQLAAEEEIVTGPVVNVLLSEVRA